MELAHRLLLVVHVLASSVGLLAMFPSLLARKGARLHRRAGRVFSVGMQTSAATGALLGALTLILHPYESPSDRREAQLFALVLLLVAALTGSAVDQAGRALLRKQRPAPADSLRELLPTLSLLLLAGFSLVVGLVAQHPLLALLGLGAALTARRDLHFAKSTLASPTAYLQQHIAAMGTASSTAVTALVVFGARRVLHLESLGIPFWLPWILPGLLLTPLFLRWSRRFETRLNSPRAAVSSGDAGAAARGFRP